MVDGQKEGVDWVEVGRFQSVLRRAYSPPGPETSARGDLWDGWDDI